MLDASAPSLPLAIPEKPKSGKEAIEDLETPSSIASEKETEPAAAAKKPESEKPSSASSVTSSDAEEEDATETDVVDAVESVELLSPDEVYERDDSYRYIDMLYSSAEWFEKTKSRVSWTAIDFQPSDEDEEDLRDVKIQCWVYKPSQYEVPYEELEEEEKAAVDEAKEYLEGMFEIKCFRQTRGRPILMESITIPRENIDGVKPTAGVDLTRGYYYPLGTRLDGALIKTDNEFWPTEMTVKLKLDEFVTGTVFDVFTVNCNAGARDGRGLKNNSDKKLVRAGVELKDGYIEFKVGPGQYSDYMFYGLTQQRMENPI